MNFEVIFGIVGHLAFSPVSKWGRSVLRVNLASVDLPIFGSDFGLFSICGFLTDGEIEKLWSSGGQCHRGVTTGRVQRFFMRWHCTVCKVFPDTSH